jgi:hypothetical protein
MVPQDTEHGKRQRKTRQEKELGREESGARVQQRAEVGKAGAGERICAALRGSTDLGRGDGSELVNQSPAVARASSGRRTQGAATQA